MSITIFNCHPVSFYFLSVEQWSSKCGLWPAKSVLLKNLSDVQFPIKYSEVRPSVLCSNKPSQQFKCVLTLEKHCCKHCKMKQYPYASLKKYPNREQKKKKKRNPKTRMHSHATRLHVPLGYILGVRGPNPGSGKSRTLSSNYSSNWFQSSDHSTQTSYCYFQAEVLAIPHNIFLLILSCHLVLYQSLKSLASG